jgi:hypothetical protein
VGGSLCEAINGTSTRANMTRLYGWAPRGQRLVAKVPHGHWQTATFLAAFNDRIEAPRLFDGPINGERFLAYVEQLLVPTLKADRTKEKRCDARSAPRAHVCYSRPNIRPTSIRSSRRSPS